MKVLQSSRWSRSITWNKLNWNTIDTVAFICGRFESLPFEDVTQVTPASSTSYLGSPSIRIRLKQNHQISKLMVKDHVHCQKHLAARTEITICLPLLCIRKHYFVSENTYEAIYGSKKTFVESWPPTSRIEFGNRLIKRSSTASTVVKPIRIQLVVLPSSSRPVHYLA